MSVLKELMNVRNIAITQLVAIPATVPALAIDFTVTAPLVKVSHTLFKSLNPVVALLLNNV